jgi:hypothetical protein
MFLNIGYKGVGFWRRLAQELRFHRTVTYASLRPRNAAMLVSTSFEVLKDQKAKRRCCKRSLNTIRWLTESRCATSLPHTPGSPHRTIALPRSRCRSTLRATLATEHTLRPNYHTRNLHEAIQNAENDLRITRRNYDYSDANKPIKSDCPDCRIIVHDSGECIATR